MLKILIISFLIFSFSFSEEFVKMDNDNLMKPSICEKIYTDCADDCDYKNSDNLTECYAQCELIVEKCIQEEERETLIKY